MVDKFANDFFEILDVLSREQELKNKVVSLMNERPIHGQSTEEPERLAAFRGILVKLVKGEISSLEKAYAAVESELPRNTSKYSGNNSVFPQNWGERLVRIQLSRFYNQAVFEILQESSKANCFVPHSSHEDSSTPCSQHLAGKEHEIKLLHERLIKNYDEGNYDTTLKIPNHPQCTHVVKPIETK